MTAFAIKTITTRAGRTGAAGLFCLGILGLLGLAGCGALPDKPGRTVLYDFGPGPLTVTAATATATAALPPITLADLDTSASRLEGTQLHYRLGYADANELRPYAGSRWTLPPTQLLRQRLRDGLAQRRTVLGTLEAANLSRTEGRTTDLLRISLEEFSHYFESPASSVGLVRVRATLVRGSPGGERVLGQRLVVITRPAPSADAAGGVKALTAATDAAVIELVQWADGLK
ncbi:ABC-type transport auxiliary lipoprotein family protein [Variovorax sp. RT4R15]|uniref:ABC-type transport auxiliary lipoprotein family protein n=1 Tax=Variovorax sp. RT4R15 TaxID=3443737 RepID=UPI003F44C8E2